MKQTGTIQSLMLAVAMLFIITLPAQAAGLLTPSDGSLPALEIHDHHVTVVIEDGYAVTTVEQVFHTPHPQDLEAIYSFPIPEHAAVSEFTLWIDGKPVSGEVLEKKEARRIYEEEKQAGVSKVRRESFLPVAQRGFGISGMAERDVREGLGRHEAKFARQANERAGRLSVNFSDKHKHYMELAKDLDSRSSRFGIPSSGGTSRDAKKTAELDTDRVKPTFFKKMHDNPEGQTVERERFIGT